MFVPNGRQNPLRFVLPARPRPSRPSQTVSRCNASVRTQVYVSLLMASAEEVVECGSRESWIEEQLSGSSVLNLAAKHNVDFWVRPRVRFGEEEAPRARPQEYSARLDQPRKEGVTGGAC